MRVAIIGSGYVGLVTAACLAELGHEVSCLDVDPTRIETVRGAAAPFYEPGLNDLIAGTIRRGTLKPTCDFAEGMRDADVSIIAVGTPPAAGGGADLSFIRTASRQIGQHLRCHDRYHVMVVKSTVVPGTTDTLVRREVEQASGKTAGQFGLCMNPEFLREGSAVSDFMSPDRIVIGQFDERSGSAVARMYETFTCPVLPMSLRNAEMVKYASNCLLSVLISFSNELASICEMTSGTDVDVVMDALCLDRRISPMASGQRVVPEIVSYLRPGIGFGGSCLPKDVNAMRSFASARNVATPLLDATIAVNDDRLHYVVRLLRLMSGSIITIGVLGLAFKAGTDDLRDSPALAMVRGLVGAGCSVRVYDPLVGAPAAGVLPPGVRVCKTPDEAFDQVDAIVLATAWPEFVALDWGLLSARMRRKLIVDGRNALRRVNWPADVEYRPIGVGPVENEVPVCGALTEGHD